MMGKRILLLGTLCGLGCGGEGTVHVDSVLAHSAALSNFAQEGTTLRLATPEESLVVQRVRIAVSEIELEGKEDDDVEFEMSARAVEVALDGQATEIVAQSVPAGTYRTLGLELTRRSPPEFGDPPASILVEGTYEGNAFDFRSTWAPEIEFPLGQPAVVEDGGTAHVAIHFDVAAWFVDANGEGLDPTDVANHPTIESNIRGSMSAMAEEIEEEGEDDGEDDGD